MIIVENKTSSSFDRTLGVPLVFNLNENLLINIDFVHNQVLPFVREYLCQTEENAPEESTSNSEKDENEEGGEDGGFFPSEIIISFEGNQYKLLEMENQVIILKKFI